jgi:hypothetical protein
MPQATITVIGRNCFGRYDIIRQRVQVRAGATCEFCGNLSARGNLYQYGTHSDGYGARPQFSTGAFCSKSCCNAYHG